FRQNSGTLFCQKASHHFDQLNWWLESDPVEVTAHGRLNVYGRNGAFRHANCRACGFKDRCGFYWDITKDPWWMKLYVDCEDSDGYYRDGCVYRSGIDIYDTMTAHIRYANGVLASYSLNAAVPYEGQFIVFNGSKGRLEVRNSHKQPWKVEHDAEIRLTKISGATTVIPVDAEKGEHGGADNHIRQAIFRPADKDPLRQKASMRAGLMSSLIGIACYTSIEQQRQPVRITDLVSWL
ncbi:MAG TPA: Gfo/Idh/MocA family oxidoreductase, partial [Candidatus Sulfotelmatobacter sp.]|nr:Gfo/Idh/MocA family oxidoreductase [Candidatus Sulfotelmatobacter sp.]